MNLPVNTKLIQIALNTLYPKYLTRFFLPLTELEKITRLKTLERKKKIFLKHKNTLKGFKKKLNTNTLQGVDNYLNINNIVLKKNSIIITPGSSLSVKKILGINNFKKSWQASLFLGYQKKNINYLSTLLKTLRIFKTSKKRLFILGINITTGFYLAYSFGILGTLSKPDLICGKNILKTTIRKFKRLNPHKLYYKNLNFTSFFKNVTVFSCVIMPFTKLTLLKHKNFKIYKNFSKSKRKRSVVTSKSQ